MVIKYKTKGKNVWGFLEGKEIKVGNVWLEDFVKKMNLVEKFGQEYYKIASEMEYYICDQMQGYRGRFTRKDFCHPHENSEIVAVLVITDHEVPMVYQLPKQSFLLDSHGHTIEQIN